MIKDLGNNVSVDYEPSEYNLTSWTSFTEVDTPKEAGIDAFTKPDCDVPTIETDIVGNDIVVTSVKGKIRINKTSSWVVKSKESSKLLEHEQGHYYINYVAYTMGLKEIKKVTVPVAGSGITSTTPPNMKKAAMINAVKPKITTIWNNITATMSTNSKSYDAEQSPGTNHGQNATEQANWNTKFSSALSGGTAI